MSVVNHGFHFTSAAHGVGVPVPTLYRWRRRSALGEPLARPRGPHQSLGAEDKEQAAALVRDVHGLIGADSLSHAVSGLSRREAAAVKKEVCTALERERKDQCQHVVVSQPGLMRGFDAMHVSHGGYWLVAADAAVPYRTAVGHVPRYDSGNVAAFLEADLSANGDPLVLRMDRAKQHDTPAVRAVLEKHGVLVLHGPPHRPSYYGQLERQNREHRAWLKTDPAAARSPEHVAEMLFAFNRRLPRRRLAWNTAEEAWRVRPSISIDRAAFRRDVCRRAKRLRRTLDMNGKPKDLAERLAIEQALEARGFLRRKTGRGC